MEHPDDMEEYLRGGSALSRLYKNQVAPMPPRPLDRRVLDLARGAHVKTPCLAPLAFAASVLLSVALVLAIVFGPQRGRRVDDSPRMIRVVARSEGPPRLYSSDPPGERRASPVRVGSAGIREPSAWLAEIASLRRAGRSSDADAELRLFRISYPHYPVAVAE